VVAERLLHVNRIKGLLFGQGIRGYDTLRRGRRTRPDELQTGDGRILSGYLKAQIYRELERLELLLVQIKAIEAGRDASVDVRATEPSKAAMLKGIEGVGLSSR
jgi:transposase